MHCTDTASDASVELSLVRVFVVFVDNHTFGNGATASTILV